MKTKLTMTFVLLCGASTAHGQESSPAVTFGEAAFDVQRDLEDSLARLAQLREELAAEMIPLSRELSALEAELSAARLEYQRATRLLDSRTLDLSNLRTEIKQREDEATYLANLSSEYVRTFESRLHIAELQRYAEPLETAKLALENTNLSRDELNNAWTGLLSVSLERLEDGLGGTRFEGTAVDAEGLVATGTFVQVGPAVLFHAAGAAGAGTAEQRLGSLEPAAIGFALHEDALAAADLATNGSGLFPLDPTLGDAHKLAATEETFVEHVKKGGAVMVPIFAMAVAALLVALYKWLAFLFVRRPSKASVEELFGFVEAGDEGGAVEAASRMKGPVGRMLEKGVAHLREPRDLIEEAMYETVLTTRLKLQSFLPFIAICAASAPLLGLLGTVTGIISTFKMITVFGSGDVKSLSGGISEALITTKFGLIVAIPSLLLHAFLSRKARGIVDQMDKTAIAFVNRIKPATVDRMRATTVAEHPPGAPTSAPDPDLVKAQVGEILNDLLSPLMGDGTRPDTQLR